MALNPENGLNHLAGGIVAALAVPLAVFGLGIPFLLSLPIAAGLYVGTAFALAPRRAVDRIDPNRIGKAQAELVAGLIEDGEAVIERLKAASGRLKAPETRKTAAHMATIAKSILDRLTADPDKLGAVRRFLTYYLPRSAELIEGLVLMESQSVPDAARMATFRETFGKLDKAFTFYSDTFAQADLSSLDAELKLLGRSLDEDLAGSSDPQAARKGT